jgi:hypothetical protein
MRKPRNSYRGLRLKICIFICFSPAFFEKYFPDLSINVNKKSATPNETGYRVGKSSFEAKILTETAE